MIKQINNILNALKGISIKVVSHGAGIELLLNDSPLKNNRNYCMKKESRF
jgi:intracellular sulfur oxidation DsrE/DsrF family protein